MPKPRKSNQKTLKPRLHIFCEGEKTEPNYLKGYIERMFPGTKLSPVRKTPKNTPVQLVEVAIEEKKKNPSGDHFWVVYDREAKTKYPDSLHAEARNKAKRHGIKIAFSGAVKEDVAFLSSFNFVRCLSPHRFLWIQRNDLWPSPIAAVA